MCIFIGECILVSNALNYTWYFTQTDVQHNSTSEYVTCFLNADYIVYYFLEDDQILSELSHDQISETNLLIHCTKD